MKTQMLASPIVLFNQCLEEYVGAETSERAFRVFHEHSPCKVLENGLAHTLDQTLNLALLGWRNVYSFLLDSEIPPDHSSGAGRICACNALDACALLQIQSLPRIINSVTFGVVLSIAFQPNLITELHNTEPDTTSAAIIKWANINLIAT